MCWSRSTHAIWTCVANECSYLLHHRCVLRGPDVCVTDVTHVLIHNSNFVQISVLCKRPQRERERERERERLRAHAGDRTVTYQNGGSRVYWLSECQTFALPPVPDCPKRSHAPTPARSCVSCPSSDARRASFGPGIAVGQWEMRDPDTQPRLLTLVSKVLLVAGGTEAVRAGVAAEVPASFSGPGKEDF